MRSIIFSITCIFMMAMVSAYAQKPQTTPNFYTNPIIAGMNPDPSVCRVKDDYYLVTSTFYWFPGVPIYHSKDLINWELIGYALSEKSQLNLEKGTGIYAATIRYNEGKFYLITTNRRNGENFYVTATDPKGKWSDPIWVDQRGIDPSLYFEGSKVYCTSTISDGIIQTEIDINTGKLLTEPKLIWRGSGIRSQEGPHLYKYKGLYYLLVSEGGTEYGHMVSMTRSTSPWGPFEFCPNNHILTQRNRNTQSALIQGAGHADMVDAVDGSWWMVFLGFRAIASHHHLGRETFLTPLSWTSAGWPLVPFDGTAQTENYTKTLPLHPFAVTPERDDFNSEILDLNWNFMRNPLPDSWSLKDRKGYLRINGKKSNLDSIFSAQFIGQRQKYFDCLATTSIEYDPKKDNEEAGLSVYHRYEGHYDLFIRKNGADRELVLRYTLGSIHHIEKIVKLKKGAVQLRVEGSKTLYNFSYSQGGEFVSLGKADAKFISSETLLTFTGVFLGMYAAGNDHDAETPADFDWFEIKDTTKK